MLSFYSSLPIGVSIVCTVYKHSPLRIHLQFLYDVMSGVQIRTHEALTSAPTLVKLRSSWGRVVSELMVELGMFETPQCMRK